MKYLFLMLLVVAAACTNKAPEPTIQQVATAHDQVMSEQNQAHPKPVVVEGDVKAPAIGSIPSTQDGTIANIYAKKKELKGKEISIRAKVMKFSTLIMNTHWIHLQDGSGSEKTADFDLTVTSKEQVKVGDIVTVKGVLSVDKNIGFGYFYPILIENAHISR